MYKIRRGRPYLVVVRNGGHRTSIYVAGETIALALRDLFLARMLVNAAAAEL